jgi:hypothetical protein
VLEVPLNGMIPVCGGDCTVASRSVVCRRTWFLPMSPSWPDFQSLWLPSWRSEGAPPARSGTRGGPGPDGGYWGFVSGGCTEAAVASEAIAALRVGHDRFLKLGEGSPFFDIVLPCGGKRFDPRPRRGASAGASVVTPRFSPPRHSQMLSRFATHRVRGSGQRRNRLERRCVSDVLSTSDALDTMRPDH